GGGGAVTSFNGRDGAVVSQAGDYSTAMVNENTNLYFTEPRVRSTPLTGLTVTNTPISSTNTFIQALGRLQGQIHNREVSFSKNTAFNKNFGTTAGTVMQGDGAYSKSESDSRYLRTTGGGLSGTLVLNDNVQLRLGTTAEAGSWGLKIQGGANNNTLFDMGQDILFRDNNGFDTRFIFRRSTGSFTASGNINANVGVFGGSSSASP